MPTKLKSSITTSAADSFLRNSPERASIFCQKIPGLHLIKLKRGASWRFRYTDEAGKRRTATIGPYPALRPETAAERVLEWINSNSDPLQAKAASRVAAKAEERRRAARSLGQYLDGAYFSRHQSRRKTGKATVQRIRTNFAHLLERDMADLEQEDIREWQQRREAAGIAHSTIQRAYGALKALLNRAVDDGILNSNPLDRVSLLPARNDERSEALQRHRKSARRLLSSEEINALHLGLEAFAERARQRRRNSRKHGKQDLLDLDGVDFPHWFIPFTHVALYTGMRPGDIYSLRWEEASLDFGKITKICEKTRHHPEPPEIGLEMAGPLRKILRRWNRQQGSPLTGLVFPSPATGKRMDKDAHRRAWRDVKELGGLATDLDFYALRHHFISSLVAEGVPILTVAKLVGQKSATMIEKHYGHLSPDSAKSAISAFSDAIRGARISDG